MAKNRPKTSHESSEQLGPCIHKKNGFSSNSPQKDRPNFAQNLGRQILWNTFSGLKKRSSVDQGKTHLGGYFEGPPFLVQTFRNMKGTSAFDT